jgi:hypothetical protein
LGPTCQMWESLVHTLRLEATPLPAEGTISKRMLLQSPPCQLITRYAPPNGLTHQSELGSADCSQLESRKGAHMNSPRASWWHSYKMTRGPSLFRSDRLGKHSKFLQPQHQPALPSGRVTPASCSTIMIKLVQRNGREAEIGSCRTDCRRCLGGHPKDLIE